ncbi:MAG TPA: hypothetical protein VK599_07590, partial [Streptosporangiaceae bacterium]|nr:hypothetical protein [Streptosporangiaceae bacterium]
GEGQLAVDASAAEELNSLDSQVSAALDLDDQAAFTTAFCALLARIRELGQPLAADSLEPSDLILPAEDATMDDIRKLLADDGLIPG